MSLPEETITVAFDLPGRFRELLLAPGERHIEYCPVLGISPLDDPDAWPVWLSTYEQAARRHRRETAFPLEVRS